ncbi:MAG: flagellar biosynthesis protein FlhA [Pseudomonadales bacterium]|nr:flagellar biosynthesis protein FlhA [Pseudomonadales bacterium]
MAVAAEDIKRGVGTGLGAPLLLIIMLGMMMLPVPAIFLDFFFTFNIAIALVVLLVTVYTLRPLEFAVFPTILLVATLLRLALNVASTRVVLINGHEGGAAAGKVIEAFGNVVIGGNIAVGIVVFAILMIINFVVVTKGAGRISEVTARFTLDAMPGKQMAIDADLNAGLIDQDEAKQRRTEVAEEADFYGSMDGASKFVRGDAIAGILILVINIVGGLIIGMVQHDLPFSEAIEKYALLTIGDGLVAQIPSLLLSTAAAIIVTRVSGASDMGAQISSQMFSNPKAVYVAAGILAVIGVVPGMPHVAFLFLAALVGGGAFYHQKLLANGDDDQTAVEEQAAEQQAAGQQEVKELGWDDVQPVDMLGLEVGYRMIPMVDSNQGGALLTRIKGVRKKLSQELGFLVPSVHIRDNLDLLPNAYRITMMGVTIGEAEIHPSMELAINPGQVFGTLKGIECKDPSFGLDAVWIEAGQREQAQTLGYTVVDASTVVATHINQVMKTHSHEILGHEEVQQLLDQLSKTSPKLVESLVPKLIPLSKLLKVLQALLMEDVPIRDMRTIAEALAEEATKSQETDSYIAAARIALQRLIIQNINGVEPELPVITLAPNLEQMLLQSVQVAKQSGGTESDAVLEPGLAEQLQSSLSSATQKLEMEGKPAILIVGAGVRPMLARFIRYTLPSMHVLSYYEIPNDKQVTIVSTVGDQE